MSNSAAVAAARARADAARVRLDASIDLAKQRLSPRTLAFDAVDGAREKASEIAQSGLQTARERPAATAAVVGAIAVALARKPILGWIGTRFGRGDATGQTDAS